MKKTIKYEVIKEVEFEEVNLGGEDSLYIYKEKITDPSGESNIQGICKKEEIDNYSEKKRITNIDKILLDKKAEYYYSSRANGEKGWHPYNYLIENPYDYIKEFGAENIGLYEFDACSDTLLDINGELLPRGIFIDYMSCNGKMTDGRYDIKHVLRKIENSDKVRFIRESDKKVLSIPSYNACEDSDFYLKFIVIPTKDEYKTFKERKHLGYDYLFDEVLGLKELKIN